mmetsp:Transcript_8730/g.14851  ORF Transcript_8730/g.14851 Transcript_8730/m.14851 type:complete len:90 (-) Transcript_8730:38-307(-)
MDFRLNQCSKCMQIVWDEKNPPSHQIKRKNKEKHYAEDSTLSIRSGVPCCVFLPGIEVKVDIRDQPLPLLIMAPTGSYPNQSEELTSVT